MGKSVVAVVMLLTMFVLSGCEKLTELTDVAEKTFQSEDMLNVSYGADAANVMDVYLPAGRGENTKVVFLVHGGSWIGGDKSEFTSYSNTLRARGYAIVNINYRLVNAAGTVRLEQQQEDLKNAINYVWNKADEWGVSKKIALVGASAGAHLSLLYTYANNADGKVKTVVSLAGPTNLTDTRYATVQSTGLVAALLGVSPTVNPQAYVNGSPILKVSGSSKPTLIFHGKKDATVNVQQSIDLKAALDLASVKNKLVVYETTGHEVVNQENITSFYNDLDIWLTENLK